MSDTLRAGLLFLIETICNLYLSILIIRLILVWVKSDYFNPISQFIVRMTNGIIKPLRQIIPNFKNLETATLVVIAILDMIKFILVTWIGFGFPNLLGIPVLALADILYLLIQTFTYAIILQAILSFLQPMSPIAHVLWRFNSPIIGPFQRLIPPLGGFDISPIPALICLQLINILLVNPLMTVGQSIAFN